MKKFAAILLCVVMLMLSVTAQAESGFVYIRDFLNSDMAEGVNHVLTNTLDLSSKMLVLVFNFEDQSIALMGHNALGQGEIVFWSTDDGSVFLTQLMTFCLIWDSMAASVDEGYTFYIWAVFEGESEPIIIDSSDAAAQMIEAIKSAAAND